MSYFSYVIGLHVFFGLFALLLFGLASFTQIKKFDSMEKRKRPKKIKV